MKTLEILVSCRLLLAGLLLLGAVGLSQAAPKKVLVVTVTKGFRHSSIPTAEKVLGELAQKSALFEVDYVRNDQEMAQKMTADALKNYDCVIFANTTGDLPLPDKQAFLDWIKSGKGFVGMHSATDTFRGHNPLDPYVEMIGGEFKAHDRVQPEVDCINQDPKHPACKDLGATFHLKDEIYLLNGFDRNKVHLLLVLDKNPTDMFYTSLGHREDVWDPKTPENFQRENPEAVSDAYQKHILGGIQWALGLAEGDAKPQAAAK